MAIKTVFNPTTCSSSGGGSFIPLAEKGVANGVVPTNANNKIDPVYFDSTGGIVSVNADDQVIIEDNGTDYPINSLKDTQSPVNTTNPFVVTYDLKDADNKTVITLPPRVNVLNFPLISTLTLPFKCTIYSACDEEFGLSITLQGTDFLYFMPNNTGATGSFYLPVPPDGVNGYNKIELYIGMPPAQSTNLSYILGGVFPTSSFKTPNATGTVALSTTATRNLAEGDRAITDNILQYNKPNGVAPLDANGNPIIPTYDTASYYVSSNTGNDTIGDGSFNFPFLTIAKALTVAGVNDEINLSSGEFVEDVILNGTDNRALKSFNEKFYGGSGNHSGTCAIKGNVTISGATTTRTRLAGMQIGTGGVGGNLTITDTLGRMYSRSSYVSEELTFNGDSNNWYEFHECGFGGNVSIFETGTPNTAVVIRFTNCNFEGATVTIGANVRVEFDGCGRIPTVTATDGNVYIRNFSYIKANASNECVVFSSTGTLYLENGTLLQFLAPNDYGKINMSAGAGRYIGKVGRKSEDDILSGVNLGYLDNSIDSMYEHDASFYPVGVTNVKEALDYLASNLPKPIKASIIVLQTAFVSNSAPTFTGWALGTVNQANLTTDGTIITLVEAGTYQVSTTFYASGFSGAEAINLGIYNQDTGVLIPTVAVNRMVASGTSSEFKVSTMSGFIIATAGMNITLRSTYNPSNASFTANSATTPNQLNFLKVN